MACRIRTARAWRGPASRSWPTPSGRSCGSWARRLAAGTTLATGPSRRRARGAPGLGTRPGAPMYAIRAPGPVLIDGDFGDWDTQELAEMTGMRFDDPALLKYKRREPEGLDDLGGEVNLMWDDKALYVR